MAAQLENKIDSYVAEHYQALNASIPRNRYICYW